MNLLGVSVTGNLILGVLGFMLSLFVFAFAIVKILDRKAEDRQGRMEDRHREEMTAIRVDIQSIHGRVSDIKDLYVRQDTHDRDIGYIRNSITEFKNELRSEISNGMLLYTQSLGDLRKDFTALLIDIASKLKRHLD